MSDFDTFKNGDDTDGRCVLKFRRSAFSSRPASATRSGCDELADFVNEALPGVWKRLGVHAVLLDAKGKTEGEVTGGDRPPPASHGIT